MGAPTGESIVNNSQIANQHEKQLRLLRALYQELPAWGTQRKDFSVSRFCDSLGLKTHDRFYVQTFEELGIISKVLEYGSPKNGMNPGRHYHYTLLMPEEEAVARLQADYDQRLAGNKAPKPARKYTRKATPAVVTEDVVTIATTDEEVTRAIAGADVDTSIGAQINPVTAATLRGMRKNESAALVEAARQYLGRTEKLDDILDSLEATAKEMGISFDRTVAMGLFTLDRDERLENVALALPYITSLEREIEVRDMQVEEMRRKVERMAELERDLAGLRRLQQERVTSTVQPAH
jgi:hypothetical protein